jgi:hypothetical protein
MITKLVADLCTSRPYDWWTLSFVLTFISQLHTSYFLLTYFKYCLQKVWYILCLLQFVFHICALQYISYLCDKPTNSTFRGPCIVIYSYNKNQWDALFLKFIFDKELLSIIRSLNTVYTTIGVCHASYVDCLLARSGRNILTLLLDSQHN